jgi:catechol 2,3-dioxygenase-like lactoylglutathione lyase family enzyme
MRLVTLFKLYVHDYDEALKYYTEKLGFEIAEDVRDGDYRWLIVKLPDNQEFGINLDLARTPEQQALVGRQAADQPLYSIETDDCMREYLGLVPTGVEFEGEPVAQPWGIGVMMRDLYGNRVYINQTPSSVSPGTGAQPDQGGCQAS